MFSQKDISRIQTESRLFNQELDFSATYLAVQYLSLHIKERPEAVTRETLQAILSVVQLPRFDTQKQAFFLYKEAAMTLIDFIKQSLQPLSAEVIHTLQDLLIATTGRKHRALSEALGALPVNIAGPDIPLCPDRDILEISFESFLQSFQNTPGTRMTWHGRTLRLEMTESKIVCIKFARSREDVQGLSMEIMWLNFLNDNPLGCEPDFCIPAPVCLDSRFIFKFTKVPELVKKNRTLSTAYTAIAFVTDRTYFLYPNEPGLFDNPPDVIPEIFQRNARLLGKLTAKGIIHTAIIPLFHNQVQQSRREDRGLYRWELGGRLDKWLESCRYPNFAKSGLRDFEHFESICDTKKLRHFIGDHILGFVLVLGSYFRNQAPDKIGLDRDGKPLDMRDLFDKSLFTDLFKDVVSGYYQGVTGLPLTRMNLFFSDVLIDTLIDHMGIDHHMEETLRIQDQHNMSESDFQRFLVSRGIDLSETKTLHKGEKDIVLNTGPHLGGFNQPISVPELIDFLFCLSALCISDRYIMENGLKAYRN